MSATRRPRPKDAAVQDIVNTLRSTERVAMSPARATGRMLGRAQVPQFCRNLSAAASLDKQAPTVRETNR